METKIDNPQKCYTRLKGYLNDLRHSLIMRLNNYIYLHVSYIAPIGTETRICDATIAMNGGNMTKLRQELKKEMEKSLGFEINGLPTIISKPKISERLYNMLNLPNE